MIASMLKMDQRSNNIAHSTGSVTINGSATNVYTGVTIRMFWEH